MVSLSDKKRTKIFFSFFLDGFGHWPHWTCRQFAWPFISRQTHFMLLFSTSFSAKHANHATLTLLRVCTGTCQVRAALLLMVVTGQWRCIFQNLLTGDLLDHEWPVTFQPTHQPVFPIVVAHRKKATCSPTTVINDFFFFSKWQNWKEVELTFKAVEWINSNQSSRLTEQNP